MSWPASLELVRCDAREPEDSRRVPRRQAPAGSGGEPARGTAQRPERDAAAEIGRDGEEEGDAVAPGDVEDESGAPRAGGRADARANGDDTEDGAQVAAGEEIGGLGGDGGAARAPCKAEEASMQPEEPALARARDGERADNTHDGDAVGEDGRTLAPDVVGDGAREDGPRDGEEAAHAQHGRRVELVEAHVHGEGELMEGDEEAAEARAEIDGEEEPEVRRAYSVLHRPVAARVGHHIRTRRRGSRARGRFGVR